MTLSAFVLAARLEEVAEAASQRLLTMTAGRYSLAHTDARRGGGGRSGLGLLACDSWTGLERDTSTLSGGETFLASLALALGLADVVTVEAAGVTIEALFVDEGFGSLDEDTLEEVMNVLDGLREGGRMVGIVSHVSELRQRIPAQIHVRKGQRQQCGTHPGLGALPGEVGTAAAWWPAAGRNLGRADVRSRECRRSSRSRPRPYLCRRAPARPPGRIVPPLPTPHPCAARPPLRPP